MLAIPDMDKAAASGWGVFFATINEIMPPWLGLAINVGILVSQCLCGLATVTSCSRTIFAFARDHGLPFSERLKRVHHTYRGA